MAGLGTLVLSLVADTGEFIVGVEKAERAAKKGSQGIGSSFDSMAAGVFKGQAALDLAKAAMQKAWEVMQAGVENAGRAIDSTAAFGTTPEKFFAMQASVEKAGDSFQSMSPILAKWNKSMAEVDEETDGKAILIKELGLNLDQLRRMDPSDSLKAVAKALQDVADPTLRVQYGTEILGKSYAEAANQLQHYAESSDEASIVTLDMMKTLDDAADRHAQLKREITDVATVLRADFQSALDELGNVLDEANGNLGKSQGHWYDWAQNAGGYIDWVIEKGAQLGTFTANVARNTGRLVETTGVYILAMTNGELKIAGQALRDYWNNADYDSQQTLRRVKAMGTLTDRMEDKRRRAKGDYSMAGKTDEERKAAQQEDFRRKEIKDGYEQARIADQRASKEKALEEARKKNRKGNGEDKQEISDQKKVVRELKKLAVEAEEAGLSPLEAAKKKLSMMAGITPKQLAEGIESINKKFRDEAIFKYEEKVKDLTFELKTFESTDIEKKIAAQAREFEKTGMTAEAAYKKAKDGMAGVLASLDSAAFAKKVREMESSIDKIGKSSYDAELQDIEERKKKMLASSIEDERKNAEPQAAREKYLLDIKYARLAQEEINDLQFAAIKERVAAYGSAWEKAMVEFAEAARKNPVLKDQAFQDDYMRIARERDEWSKLTRVIADSKSIMSDVGSAMMSSLEGVLMGTMSVADGFKNIGKALERMIIQSVLLKPLQRQLDDLVESMTTAGARSSAGGGSFLGGLLNFIFNGGDGEGWRNTGNGMPPGYDPEAGAGSMALGGNPLPGSLTRVAEGGRPELYDEGGNTYLLAGSRGGHVRPASDGGLGGGTSVVQHITIDARGADAGVDQKIREAMEQTRKQTLAEVQARAGRGGTFAKAVGRA